VTGGLQGVTMQIMRSVFVAVFAVVPVLLAPAACSTSSAGAKCSPGQMLTCSCGGSLSGTTTCDSSGTPLACQCGAGSSGGGSGGGGGSTSSGGTTGSSSGSGSGGMEGGGGGGDATTDGPGDAGGPG
jgi:hypothetical protein